MLNFIFIDILSQCDRGAQILGATSPWRIAVFTEFPNICGSSVWNLLHVTHFSAQNFDRAPRLIKKFVLVKYKIQVCAA
jgi:hypothetical protein